MTDSARSSLFAQLGIGHPAQNRFRQHYSAYPIISTRGSYRKVLSNGIAECVCSEEGSGAKRAKYLRSEILYAGNAENYKLSTSSCFCSLILHL